MKRLIFAAVVIVISFLGFECGSNSGSAETNNPGKDTPKVIRKTDTVVVFVGIAYKGIGRFRDVKLTNPLDAKLVSGGEKIYLSKCIACHKLTKELLVGQGWAGVTERRTHEWIMNWINNKKI
jgi:mono/diheme cytochrome c family protein